MSNDFSLDDHDVNNPLALSALTAVVGSPLERTPNSSAYLPKTVTQQKTVCFSRSLFVHHPSLPAPRTTSRDIGIIVSRGQHSTSSAGKLITQSCFVLSRAVAAAAAAAAAALRTSNRPDKWI